MKHSKFFFIDSTQTWVNIMHIETVFYIKGWQLTMTSGSKFKLTDAEYIALKERLEAVPEPPKKED